MKIKHTLAVALMIGLAGAAHAQTITHAVTGPEAAAAATYWTPERMAHAKPMEMHPRSGFKGLPLENSPAARGLPRLNSGNEGSDVEPGDTGLFEPIERKAGGDQPMSWFGFGFFTESRVTPPAAHYSYPFRAVGQLFFHDPRTGGNFVCSASTVSPRGIATAGHCVAHGSADPNQRYWYTNWLYVPAIDSGVAPYGTWGWRWAITTWDWFGNGNVPNAHDFAIIEAVDHGTTRVGAWVGWLGWWTQQLGGNHETVMGYPCNLDSCARMQRNDAQIQGFGGNNTWYLGSSMRGGASGGPWVRDFGVAPTGNPVTAGGNWVTGVTSYGPIATNVGYLGASMFDGVWIAVWNTFCGVHAGNC